MRKFWNRFKRNRRAYYAFLIFSITYGLSLGGDFIANENPLLVYQDGHIYFPIFTPYSEIELGGSFESPADFRDPVFLSALKDKGWVLNTLIPYSIHSVNYTQSAPAPPSLENWLGTDDQGRDVLTRLIFGFRISVSFGILLTLFSTIIGFILGSIQGYFGGLIDLIMQRCVEIWNGLPVLYILIIVSSLIEPSFLWLLLVMLFFSWMPLVSVIRAEFLRSRTLDYVRAAEILGVSPLRIMSRHILPNATISALTYIPFLLNNSIVTLTALDFLGFGLPPGSASLGELIVQAKNNIHAIWLGGTAFFSVVMVLGTLIFIGEGVRDALDPRK